MNDVVFNAVWQDLQQQINALNVRLSDVTQKTARSETVGGFQSFSYAARPLAVTGGMQSDNTQYVDMGFCYDARKSGEGGGAGTGVPCFYDPAVDDWRRFEDNAIVSV
jgi:hypothetical protein